MRIKPPFKYYGGKFYLSPWIIQQFPNHSVYVEPFGGAASVLLNKPRATQEIYSDLNQDLVSLMLAIRDSYHQLTEHLYKIPCEETVYYQWKSLQTQDSWQRAIRAFVLYRMSRGGTGGSFSKSKRTYRGLPENVAAWETGIANLRTVHERLQGVELLCGNALELLPQYDNSNTLFYLDPPYVAKTRESAGVYIHETTDELHQNLAAFLVKCRAKVVLSGYDSPLYGTWFSHWNRVVKDQFLHASHGTQKKIKQEILWKNF